VSAIAPISQHKRSSNIVLAIYGGISYRKGWNSMLEVLYVEVLPMSTEDDLT
jgi:hypothetical protein